MDRSRHTVTKYLSDGKTHATIKGKIFEKLDHVNKALYEIELAKAQVENKEPTIVGFYIFQNAKLQMLELYSNFFTTYGDANNAAALEMDIDSL